MIRIHNHFKGINDKQEAKYGKAETVHFFYAGATATKNALF
jgi:hypothetical protein